MLHLGAVATTNPASPTKIQKGGSVSYLLFILFVTTDERQLFEVKLRTESGSWLENIATADFWSALFSNSVGKMSGLELAVTIVICVAIVSGYLVVKSRDKRLIAVEQEKTKQSEIHELAEAINAGQKLLAGAKPNPLGTYIEKTRPDD